MPPWLTVACQVYSDLFDGFHLGLASAVAPKISQRMASSITSFGEVYEDYDHRALHLSGARQVFAIFNKTVAIERKILSTIATDESPQTGCYSGKSFDRDGKTTWIAAGIFRELPLSRAVYLHDLVNLAHRIGIKVANDNHVVLLAAHLYNAAKCSGLLTSSWEDMDHILSTRRNGRKKIVHQDRNFETLLGHLQVSLGIAPTVLSEARKNLKANGGAKKRVRVTARDTSTYIHSSSDYLEAMIERVVSDHDLGFSRGDVIDTVLRSMQKARQEEKPPKPTRKSPKVATCAVTGLQLVQTFRQIIATDSIELAFDFAGFWTVCADLLQEVKVALDLKIPETINHCRSHLGLAVVGTIIVDAVKQQRQGLAKKDMLLAKAANLMAERIKMDGRRFLDLAEERLAYRGEDGGEGETAGEPGPSVVGAELPHLDPSARIAIRASDAAEPLAAMATDDGQDHEREAVDMMNVEDRVPDLKKLSAAGRNKKGRRLLRTRK